MSSLLFTIGSFIVALAILIAVHEFGHFWVARKLGVKVLRFSIGFGKPLFRYREKSDQAGDREATHGGGTEYVVAAIPLGGYVRMLDEREGDVPSDQLHQAFNRKPLSVRAAIVFAGPLFNFLFAILAFWAVYVIGDTGSKPWIGEVEPKSVAEQSGFQHDDLILEVNGETTQTWESTVYALLQASTDDVLIPVRVQDAGGSERLRSLPGKPLLDMAEDGKLLQRLGIKPKRPQLLPVIGKVLPGEPADQAGLKPGDRVLALDGVSVPDWLSLVKEIQQRPMQRVLLDVETEGYTHQVELITGVRELDGVQYGRIGASVEVPEGVFEPYRVEVSYGPVDALLRSVSKTAEMSGFMLKMLGKMVTGQVSVKNLSGPISIAQTAGQTASYGFVQFLKFLALVSVSLGVLNLLPVPVLDGGHLFFFFIEWIKGSPLSEQAQIQGQKIGIALLLGLMGLAFYVDLSRLFG